MFTTYGRYGNQDNNLHLFVADDLFGEFAPHPKNPIKLDIASSRMAGRFFRHEGRLLRPSQNGSRRYGGSLVLNEVLSLSRSDYSERRYKEILPDSRSDFCHGMHTMNFVNGITAIAGLKYVTDPNRQASDELWQEFSLSATAGQVPTK